LSTNSWETTTGGALPGQDGPIRVQIENCEFNYDAQYQNGDVLVFVLEGECDHEYWQGTVLYSIGNGWDTDDNEVVTGRDQFNGSTRYARFFNAALATKAGDIIMERAGDVGPADATIFNGLEFDFESKQYTTTFGGEERINNILLPVKFIGEVGKKKKKKGGKKGKADGGLRAKVLKLASKHDDHDEFVEAVLDKFPEVEDDEDLYDEVLDEDGIFEEA